MGKAVLALGALLTLLWLAAPIAWMITTSFLTETELMSGHLFPQHPSLDNYRVILGTLDVAGNTAHATLVMSGIRNSVVVALGVMALNILIGAPAAYAFALLPVPLKRPLLGGFLFARFMPPLAFIVPLFMLFRTLELVDSQPAVIIAQLAVTLPITTWFLVAYLRAIPRDLERAARADGCSEVKVFWHIMVPLIRPGLFGAAIVAFMTSWNDFLFVLILISSPAVQTVQPVIAGFFAAPLTGPIYGLIMAGATLAAIPPIVLAIVFQRHLVRGLTSGAVVG